MLLMFLLLTKSLGYANAASLKYKTNSVHRIQNVIRSGWKLMKLSHVIISAALCLSITACQTPLYKAVESNNVTAVKRELAKGADPDDKPSGAHWIWRGPLLPIVATLDLAELALVYGTGGLGAIPLCIIYFPFCWPCYSVAETVVDFSLTEGVYGAYNTSATEIVHSPEVAYAMAFSPKMNRSAAAVNVYRLAMEYALERDENETVQRLLSMGAKAGTEHLSTAISRGNWAGVDLFLSKGIKPEQEHLSEALKKNNTTYADKFISMGIKPDGRDLCIVLANKNYAYAKKLMSMGVAPSSDMLIQAIKTGDATAARMLIDAGLSLNAPLYQNSYQFIAAEAGHLDLYIKLGGIMVSQPEAPPIDCPSCGGDGISGWSTARCGACGGGGTLSSSYTKSNWYAGCDPNDPNTRGYSTVTSESTCRSCGGSGRVEVRIPCKKCEGKGKVSRYQIL